MELPKWLYESLPATYGLSGTASLKYFLAESTLIGTLSSTVLIVAAALIWYLRYDHRSNNGGRPGNNGGRPGNHGGGVKATQRRRVAQQSVGSRTRR